MKIFRNHIQLIYLVLLLFNEIREDSSITFNCDNQQIIENTTLDRIIQSSNVTPLRLNLMSRENTNYKFEIKFQRTGGKCKNIQRCNLMTWQSIRELEKYLKNYPSTRMQDGLIEIDNNLLSPDLKYFLKVYSENDGMLMEEKEFYLGNGDNYLPGRENIGPDTPINLNSTINNNNNTINNNSSNSSARLTLYGSNTTYAYTNYLINAHVSICSKDIKSYYFKWELLDKDLKSLKNYSDKNSEFEIQARELQASREYILKCSVMDSANNTLVSDVQNIKVLNRGLIVNVTTKFLMIGKNQPITINAYIDDMDNTNGNIQIDWSCLKDNEEVYKVVNSTSELNIENGLSEVGIYSIKIDVTKNNNSMSDACEVQIIESNTPVIEIYSIDSPLVNPSSGVEIRAHISELHTLCTLQWTSIEESGVSFLDLSTLPGEVDIVFNVTLKEDAFLNELAEFSNGTIDKEHDLIIPPAKDSSILKGDTKYKFRINATCPKFIDEVELVYNETEPLADDVDETESVFADVIIQTNAPPTLQSLEVNPTEGEAFKTLFTFVTNKATDTEIDLPIIYKYSYILNGREIYISQLTGNFETTSILPYAENGLQTFLECCDNLNSCNHIMGPKVTLKLPENKADINLDYFKENMLTQDYSKSFSYAVGVVNTYNAINDENSTINIEEEISDAVLAEINALLTIDETDEYSRNTAQKLMKSINNFNQDIKFSEDVLNGVVKLRNKFSGTVKYERTEILLTRKLLSISKLETSIKNFKDLKDYLEISELIITSSSDLTKIGGEKDHVIQTFDAYIPDLCKTALKKNQKYKIELKTFILSIEKILKIHLKNFITIPYNNNPWNVYSKVKFGKRTFDEFQNDNDVCVAKAILKNYLHKDGLLYMINLYNLNQEAVNDVTVLLPATFNSTHSAVCLVYYNVKWIKCKTLNIKNTYLECSCPKTGYYYVAYETITVPSKVWASTITPIQTLFTFSDIKKSTKRNNFIPTTEKSVTITSNTEITPVLGNISEGPNNYDTVSYVAIVFSIIGIGLLGFFLKRTLSNSEDEDNDFSDDTTFPKYASLHEEELLHEEHM